MKFVSFIALSVLFFNVVSCSIGQTVEEEIRVLDPKAFYDKLLNTTPNQLIDVRTPGEFAGGSINGALNLDWNGYEFKNQAETLDRDVPVFVYCLSGGRSAVAADYLRGQGFKAVYELSGGMMKWRAEGLPETKPVNSQEGMSFEAFNDSVSSDKIVLVDFYAEWCAPCKKMKPELEALANELKDDLIVLRIDADQNRELCEKFGITSLPVVQIYSNKELKWTNKGYTDKESLKKEIDKLK